MGLFERAAETPPEKSPPSSFQQWAEFSHFAHCGVFCAQSKFMLLKHAYGIPCETVLKSISTNDFWRGSAAGDEWILPERGNERFTAFLQFLENDEKENAARFAILRLSDPPTAFFFAYTSNEFPKLPSEENFRREVLAILESKKSFFFRQGDEKKISGLVGNSGALVLTASLEPLFKKIFSGEEKNFFSENPEAKKILSNTIFEEFFFTAKKHFPWPDFVYAKDFSKIKIVSILTRKKRAETMREKIVDAGKEIFKTPHATQIAVEIAAQTFDAEEIISYILRGED